MRRLECTLTAGVNGGKQGLLTSAHGYHMDSSNPTKSPQPIQQHSFANEFLAIYLSFTTSLKLSQICLLNGKKLEVGG